MEIDDITDFLPIYPEIDEADFSFDIYRKKEFYNERLKQTEIVPKVPGQLLQNQKIMTRYMSSRTPYDKMLIVNEMGTGKTCLTTGIIEQIKRENNGFKKAVILARGEGIINNFKNEIVFKCTKGQYIPENYDNITALEATHRINKSLDEFYEFKTFVTFAKMVEKTNVKLLKESYNNSIIVIDEVHNLRIQDKEEGINVYRNIWNFLHLIKNCKIILLSGTPMKDSPEEITSIMNLILPTEENLPTGQEFINLYMDLDLNSGLMKIKRTKIRELKTAFKGKMSYLLAMKSEIPMEYQGVTIENQLREFKVEPDQMSTFQSEAYNKAYDLDVNSEKKGIYSNSRQAILFVFPDRTYGEAGFKKYMNIKKDPKTKKISFRLEDNLKSLFRGTEENKLETLSRFSSKYAMSIANILKSRREKKSIFIYCEFVQGSGAILFASILEQFGFTQASGNEGLNQFAPRYAIITNTTATLFKMRKIIDRFNKPDNANGQVINVIIGSKVISEGFSLLNVQVVDVLTPHWNYSEITQAIARGYRLGSHNDLITKGISPTFHIYQRVSFSNNKPSIDLEMYKISEIKDINIKQIERIIKESSFDCPLNYERNRIRNPDSNGKRECEYMNCDYKCDLEPVELKENDIDNSTYQLYYSQMDDLVQEIKTIYRLNFILSFEYLSNTQELNNYTDFELISSLNYMINNNIEITNKYGISSYLRESNNIYFLVDNLTISGDVSLSYYTKYPILREDISQDEMMEPIYISLIPNVINKIFESKTVEDLPYYFNKLSNEINEMMIEHSIVAEINDLEKNRLSRKLILKYFENYFKRFEDEEGNPIWISWYLLDKDNIIRYMFESSIGEWFNGDENIRDVVLEYKKTLQDQLDNNPYGFYGQINRGKNKFCIRDVRTKVLKKHKQLSGRVCSTIHRYELINLASRILNIDGNDIALNNETNKSKLWNKINSTKNYLSKSIADKKIELTNESSIEEMRRFIYWGNKNVKDLCNSIQNWLEVNGLLVEDEGCGKQGKIKK
jgi:superfamily II DNA or RNA helicase